MLHKFDPNEFHLFSLYGLLPYLMFLDEKLWKCIRPVFITSYINKNGQCCP
jgi:hypothetical protein